jgi:hypothetical protein
MYDKMVQLHQTYADTPRGINFPRPSFKVCKYLYVSVCFCMAVHGCTWLYMLQSTLRVCGMAVFAGFWSRQQWPHTAAALHNLA